MFAITYSVQLIGLLADIIEIEVDVAKGLHSFSIVGLGDKAIDEAKDRINAAIKNTGFKAPARGNRKVTVSLAPADIKKTGTHFDVGIALSYLKAVGDIKFDSQKKIFLGELALDGSIRPIKGTLFLVQKAKEKGYTEIFLPLANATEAGLITGINIYPCLNLKQIISHLSPKVDAEGKVLDQPIKTQPPTIIKTVTEIPDIDFSDIKGQDSSKRGLIIAASGGHNIAMSGPPGTGKTMLARSFIGILPPLSFADLLEVTGIHSTVTNNTNLITTAPFRSPHHTSSYVALVGGGAYPKPGEITLAHRGVLFLDEFPEFDKRVIEALRQPLEDRKISVARAKHSLDFPADFILIAAMNPCPCGFRGSKNRECVCGPIQLARYERKISGPIVDRIDLWLQVGEIKHSDLSADNQDKKSASLEVRKLIQKARAIQAKRFANTKIKSNAHLSAKNLKQFAPLDDETTNILNITAGKLNLSPRSYHRIIKIARTIADLEACPNIKKEHLLEALQYRPKIEK